MSLLDRLLASLLHRRLARRTSQIEADLKERASACVAHATKSWCTFNSTFRWKEGTTLADQIDMFAIPFEEYVKLHHPILLTRPGFLHLMMFTGILEANTHSKDAVNSAIADDHETHIGVTVLSAAERRW